MINNNNNARLIITRNNNYPLGQCSTIIMGCMMHKIKYMCKLDNYMILWLNRNDITVTKGSLHGLKVTFNNPWIFVHR